MVVNSHPLYRLSYVGMIKNKFGAVSRTRTCDMVVNSHPLYRLSYDGAFVEKKRLIMYCHIAIFQEKY